jgi:hypothetical protein
VSSNDIPLVHGQIIKECKSFDSVSHNDLDFWSGRRTEDKLIANAYLLGDFNAVKAGKRVTRIFLIDNCNEYSDELRNMLEIHQRHRVGWALAFVNQVRRNSDSALDFAIFNMEGQDSMQAVSYSYKQKSTPMFRVVYKLNPENDKEIQGQISQYQDILRCCSVANEQFISRHNMTQQDIFKVENSNSINDAVNHFIEITKDGCV